MSDPDFPPRARRAAEPLQALTDTTGLRVFSDPGVDASQADAQEFVALAVHHLDAIGFFRRPSDGPTLYLAVHHPPSGHEGRAGPPIPPTAR